MDLESIEQVLKQNQLSGDDHQKPLKSSLKSKTVPVVHVQQSDNSSSNHKSTKFKLETGEIVGNCDTNDDDDYWQNPQVIDMIHNNRKPRDRQVLHPARIEYRDFHSEKLRQKYGELQDLLTQDVVQSRRTASHSPQVMAYARGIAHKHGFRMSCPELFNQHISSTNKKASKQKGLL